PYRTQKLSSPAPMVVGGSPCESRTPPGKTKRQDRMKNLILSLYIGKSFDKHSILSKQLILTIMIKSYLNNLIVILRYIFRRE
ncbi:hypothetical protein WH51_15325, partial [Bacilli bacterium VT-13-104]